MADGCVSALMFHIGYDDNYIVKVWSGDRSNLDVYAGV